MPVRAIFADKGVYCRKGRDLPNLPKSALFSVATARSFAADAGMFIQPNFSKILKGIRVKDLRKSV